MTRVRPEAEGLGHRFAATTVAFCGIDGAGKTTLIRELIRTVAVPNSISLRKRRAPNATMVRQATAATHAVEAQVTANPLSPLLGVSYALDFRDYFNDVVAFELRRQQLILLDRWRPCVLAVADMCGADSDVIRDVIRPIPEADLTVFVRVDPAKARRRIETRGQPAFDEGIATLRALEASYERTLTHERGLIVEVVNDDLETAVAFLGGLVGGLAASRLDATHRQLLSVRARPMHPTESVA